MSILRNHLLMFSFKNRNYGLLKQFLKFILYQMEESNEEKAAVSPKTKLEKISSFCESFGCAVKKIIQYIIERLNDLPEKYITLIDILWKSIKGLTSGTWKDILVEAIKILGYILSLVGLAFPMVGLISRVVLLVASFLKIIFSLSDLKAMLKPESMVHESLSHEMAGLAERLKRTAIFIDAVDVEEHVDESTLQSLISNVDIHVGVEQIGNLKSRIQTLMSGGLEEWHACLHLMKLFVGLATLRHLLLFRMVACLKAKDYSLGTVKALQMYMEKERIDNQAFFTFFSVPSLENVGVLSVFDPSRQEEIVTFLQELHLSLQDLNPVLHGRVFSIKSFTNPSILLGRPFPSVSSVRAMKNSTDVRNVRINFRFTAIANEFNLFHIQSPDLGEFVYMKENSYCKYEKMLYAQEKAQWRILLVREAKGEEKEAPSCFILCTRKWPEKFIYMEKSFFECAKGLENNSKPNRDSLFMVCLF